jgi:hypothetical protein
MSAILGHTSQLYSWENRLSSKASTPGLFSGVRLPFRNLRFSKSRLEFRVI